jgi:outer membrane receptor protein involved in Fe transport
MPRFIQFIFISFLCLFFQPKADAQDTSQRISVNFNAASISEVVKEIQAKSGFHFYYDGNEFNSLTFTYQGESVTIPFLLKQLLPKTGFYFSIDANSNRVFLTKAYLIQTTLPGGFWANKNTGIANADKAEPPQKIKEKSNLKGVEENKLVQIGTASNNLNQDHATLAGYIRDAKNGESIYGATISVDTLGLAVTTDQFGYYSITIPKGRHTVIVSGASMKDVKRQIILYSDGKLNVELKDNIVSLKAVVVTSETKSNVKSIQMGAAKLNIRSIKQVPVVFGETDIIKVVLTLPGVTSVGEASTGFNVRGGASDQNLILFNDATIYNPSHLFGFFSAFNPDVVKGIELYKSAIPEKYGGRLSSVLDVSVKEGNTKKWSGFAGIGPLTSKFTIEGPLKKEKTSIIFGARTTYSNWLLNSLKNNAYNKSKAAFYDLNLHISHTINAHNSIYITGYTSNDNFRLNGDTTYQYNNQNANIKWKHIFNNKIYAVATLGADRYEYAVSSTSVPVNGYKLGFTINQKYFRADFNYAPNNRHSINFGVNSIYYQLSPGYFQPKGASSLVVPNTVAKEHGLESAVYLGDEIKISSSLSVNAGLRYTLFNYLGAHDVYTYAAGVPRTANTIKDTTRYPAGKNIKTYSGPEFRFALRYALSDNASIKLSYNTLRQYIHMLSNTTAISPTDIWKLSDPYIKPQEGQQISMGFYRDFKSNTIETSVEIYYKKMKHYLDYKSGAALVLNHHIETETINTRGKAYGVEVLIKKTSGKMNGWLSYTYSKTFLQQDDPLAGETINKGSYYPASFDKPHSVNLIANYRFSHRYSVSTNGVYSTGRPITLPLAVFTVGGASSLYYSKRNQYRIPDYLRFDFSVNIDGNHKVKQKTHNSWSVGVYNLLFRQNAYSVYFVNENGRVKGYQLSIFGTAIPFVTYNLKF